MTVEWISSWKIDRSHATYFHQEKKINFTLLSLVALIFFNSISIKFTNATKKTLKYFTYCFLLAIDNPKQRKWRKSKKWRQCFVLWVYLQLLWAGRRGYVVGLMDEWMLMPDVDHDRCIIKTPFVVFPQNFKYICKQGKHLLTLSLPDRLL